MNWRLIYYYCESIICPRSRNIYVRLTDSLHTRADHWLRFDNISIYCLSLLYYEERIRSDEKFMRLNIRFFSNLNSNSNVPFKLLSNSISKFNFKRDIEKLFHIFFLWLWVLINCYEALILERKCWRKPNERIY